MPDTQILLLEVTVLPGIVLILNLSTEGVRQAST